MNDVASVQFVDVSKTFGEVVAVDHLDLTIADGEFLVMVGPSGCGKTTALRMIAGLEESTSGTILIGDRDVTFEEPKDRDIGMVFQNYALYPQMTVWDNIAFGLRQRKVSRDEIAHRVGEVASMLDLDPLLARRPKQLSGGQRQRVALGRAIAREPRVFLMDEPLSNLDAQLRAQTRAELMHLHRRIGVTTVYVTHDQVEAMTMGSRIAVMHAGRLQQVASPQEVYDQPANTFVARFIGSPPMNLVTGTIDTARSLFIADGLTVGPVDSGRDRHAVTLGIRPEHLIPVAGEEDAVFTGAVELVEPLGSDLLVTATHGTTRLTARVDPHTLLAAGDTVRLGLRTARLSLFDAEGKRIEVPTSVALAR